MSFMLKRIGFYLFTAWAAITINFFIPRLMPGDPVLAVLGRFQGQISTQAIHSLYVLFGLDKHESLWQQYVDYWKQLCHGNLGLSFTYFPTPVVGVLREQPAVDDHPDRRRPRCSASSSVRRLGVVAGWRRGSWVDGAAAGDDVPVLGARTSGSA